MPHMVVVPGQALSPRETGILILAAQGLTNEQIGARVRLKASTVKTYLDHIFVKLIAVNRTHAVAIALTRGLISVPELETTRGTQRPDEKLREAVAPSHPS